MRKMFLLAALCCTISALAETEFTFSTNADMNQTKDGISLVIAVGTSQNTPTVTSDYETKLPEMRLYAGNTITLSGTKLTNIQLVCAKSSASNKAYTGLNANEGTLKSGGEAADKNDWKVDSWTGNASKVIFTLTGSGQRRIQRILIDGEPIVITPIEDELPTEADLQTEYSYSEPTVVLPKDTTIWKKEYAFITNNILVHCDMGSIEKKYIDPNADEEKDDSHPAFFNCNANYTITFTAAQNIKGIAISGYVRKAFNATCDNGHITFMTDPDMEMEAWPAIVITDVNSKSVTLSCPTQFRCYQLKVYFKENPDPIDMGTGVEKVESGELRVKSQKVLRDGQLLIQHDGKTFTPAGIEIR